MTSDINGQVLEFYQGPFCIDAVCVNIMKMARKNAHHFYGLVLLSVDM